MSEKGLLIYCRADEGKWKQVSCDRDRWESLKAFGGWMENGNAGGLGKWKWLETVTEYGGPNVSQK